MRKGRMKLRARAAVEQRPSVEAAAKNFGLTLTVSEVKTRRWAVQHWQFRQDGIVVLHWWPSRGTYWVPYDGRKGNVTDPHAALLLARWVVGEADRETEDLLCAAGVI